MLPKQAPGIKGSRHSSALNITSWWENEAEHDTIDQSTTRPFAQARGQRSLMGQIFLAAIFMTIGLCSSIFWWRPHCAQSQMLSPMPLGKPKDPKRDRVTDLGHLDIREVNIETMWMPNDTFNPPGGRTPESDRSWDSRHKSTLSVISFCGFVLITNQNL
jgi:hypothetical protein